MSRCGTCWSGRSVAPFAPLEAVSRLAGSERRSLSSDPSGPLRTVAAVWTAVEDAIQNIPSKVVDADCLLNPLRILSVLNLSHNGCLMCMILLTL